MLQGPGSLLLIVLASHCCLGSARGLFFGQSDFPYKRSNCKPIPANLQLCHGIEYQNMRLPNLLGHETMKEVLEQAGAWIPLVMKQCHPDTKKFLCSLFAPVCLDDLDETIQPCHSLCVQVKDRCAPVMSAFGFPWPDMLDCDRFPQDNDLCIPLASSDHLLPATEEGRPSSLLHPHHQLHEDPASRCVDRGPVPGGADALLALICQRDKTEIITPTHTPKIYTYTHIQVSHSLPLLYQLLFHRNS